MPPAPGKSINITLIARDSKLNQTSDPLVVDVVSGCPQITQDDVGGGASLIDTCAAQAVGAECGVTCPRPLVYKKSTRVHKVGSDSSQGASLTGGWCSGISGSHSGCTMHNKGAKSWTWTHGHVMRRHGADDWEPGCPAH